MIFGIFFVIFLVVNPFLNWSVILNGPQELRSELSLLVLLTVGFFLLRFIFRLISIIIMADQRPALSNLFDPLSNVVALGAILVLMKTTSPSLLYLGIVLGSAPVVVLLAASLYFFNRDYKEFRPTFKQVNFKYFNDLAGLGVQFFVIQITVVVIMSTNNLIIAQVVGPEAVTSYNVAYKYFGLISMGFVIITNTYWSAFTEAYVKKDFEWIKKVMRSLIRIWVIIVLLIVVMLAVSAPFYKIWVGEKVFVPFILSAFTALFVVVYVWYSIFVYFINGTGKIKLQLITSVIVAVLNIPLSIFLARNLGMGAAGVILGSCITYLPGAILGPIQYYKLVNEKATGVWGK
jgi:O-antigen/teichoic acid export membrane protein